MKLLLFIITMIFVPMISFGTNRGTIKISNETKIDRVKEMVCVSASDLIDALDLKIDSDSSKKIYFKVFTADEKEVVSQLTYDNQLIFQVDVAAKSNVVFHYEKCDKNPIYKKTVWGRKVPERLDDLAWENDNICYRIYGPGLYKTGDKSWGSDIWNKNTSRFIINERYKRGHYHKDFGDGMDNYLAGASLGAGCSGILLQEQDGSEDSIIYIPHYKTVNILDNGPLRFTAFTTQFPIDVNGNKIIAHRLISLDAGSFFNKEIITFDNLKNKESLVTGIVMRNEKDKEYKINKEQHWATYKDFSESRNPQKDGFIYIGMIVPEKWNGSGIIPIRSDEKKAIKQKATGHLSIVTSYKKKAGLVTYWGAAWQKGSIKSMDSWNNRVNYESIVIDEPLKVKVK